MGNRTEFDLKKVEELASKGLTQNQIAEYFGVAPATISNHKKFEAFAASLSKGKSKGIAKVANSLFEKATNGDTAAAIFFLRAKAGWIDQKIHAKVSQEVSTVTLTPEDISLFNKQLEDEY